MCWSQLFHFRRNEFVKEVRERERERERLRERERERESERLRERERGRAQALFRCLQSPQRLHAVRPRKGLELRTGNLKELSSTFYLFFFSL